MSKAWANVLLLAGIAGSISTSGMYVCFVSVLCCEVEVSVTGRSHIQRNPTEWGHLEYDREA